MKTINIEWIQPDERPMGREDSAWYTYQSEHDLVAYVTDGENTISIHADGEMRVAVYLNPANKDEGWDIVRYCDDWTDYEINNDAEIFQASEEGRIDWWNNSWFDLYTEDGEHLDCVCHTLTEAISQAVALLNEKEI